MISVVVPCYNETSNIRPLCKRLFDTIENSLVELLIMDDESDGSPDTKDVVRQLQDEGYNIYLYHRKRVDGRGLSSAVLNGILKATNEVVVVMDGDLQHEPESVPNLAMPVLRDGYDCCIGVRHELVFNWSYYRRLVSWVATNLAYGLTDCSDPMSGFFCVRRSLVLEKMNIINPIGFKIGLELMVKCDFARKLERGIIFRDRLVGESKMSIKHYILYLIQLLQLYNYENNLFVFLFVVSLLFIILIKLII